MKHCHNRKFTLLPVLRGMALAWACTAQTAVWSAEAPQPTGAEALANSASTQAYTRERELYRQARRALQENDRATFTELKEQLADYPLLPYLEYAQISADLDVLDKATQAAVDLFLNRHRDTYLAQQLEREWVAALAEAELWPQVRLYHDPRNTNATLTCQALRASLETGDTSVLPQVAELWNVPVSQPNDCDPVFETWMSRDLMTPDIVWERFTKTVRARNLGLARYLARQLPDSRQRLAQLYLNVDADPGLIAQQAEFRQNDGSVREIAVHGLQRLALQDARQAMELLHELESLRSLDEEQKLSLQRAIALRQLFQGDVEETEALLEEAPQLISETLAGWIIRDALRHQDWPRVSTWLARLPAEAQTTERWQYWRARTLSEEGSPAARQQARAIHEQLAETRSFYGFLSADLLSRDYELVNRPVEADAALIRELEQIPAIERARELFLVGDEFNARAEWQHAMSGMSPEQVIAGGRLAANWGWHNNAIQAMIQVNYWDDIALRFPLAFQEPIRQAAQEYDVAPEYLMAIARQESAFMRDARSPAGALGLMQLMPATARQTAREVGMQITTQDLFSPEVNIALGSRYLYEQLLEFHGNRALAAAAYNAGPNRVKQWLRETAENPVPMDIWIEIIPYAETRGYVQNVLAFSVIFGKLMGRPVEMLTAAEAVSEW